MSGLILYTTEDGKSRIQLRADEQTVWLTQLEMADLFDATKQNVSLHLKNLFEDGELDPAATVKESVTVQAEGGREASGHGAFDHFPVVTKMVGQGNSRSAAP